MSASKKGTTFTAIQQAEEEAHESDVLEDSSDEESEHGGEDALSDKCNMVDDANEEEYGNFLRSCFCNEEDAYSLLSFNDEDEDQDYQPPSRKNGYDNDDEDDDEDEDDDDGDDDGLVKVAQTELVDLVDGCWQTITGASLTFLDRDQPSMVDQSSRGSSKRDYSEFSESEFGNMDVAHTVDGNKKLRSKATTRRRDASATGMHVIAPLHTGGSLPATSSQTHDAAKNNNKNHGIVGGVASAVTGGMNAPTRNGSRNASSNSLISSLVRQIFSGEKPSALCVDGMPVEAIRKLVARQMSMASQLLIQMLMMAEDQDRAGCFNSCYTSLMELSNHRESSLRKASLLQMSLKNLLGSAQQVSSNNNMVRRNSSSSSASYSSSFLPGTTAGFDYDNSDGSPAEMRMTRAAAGRLYKSNGVGVGLGGFGDPDSQDSRNGGGGMGRERHAPRVSVFDLPLLSNITELFEAIDVSRQDIALQVATVEEGDSVAVSHRSLSSAAARDMEIDLSFRKRCKALYALRCQMQHIARSVPAATMSGHSNKTRLWSCLLPSSNFPLGEDILRNTCRAGPCSLQGRSVFTPAEDDLLLRGIMKYGDGDQQRPGQPSCWALIKTQFLPSKEEQLLQFRFRQMTAPTAKDDSKFKRYMTLDKTLPGGILVGLNSWSRDEDLDLLRGFQIYGNKWPLIAVFFFPHKCRKELKNRWTMIQRYWERSFSGRLERITFDTKLPATSQTFLRFLKASSLHSTTSPFPSPQKSSSAHAQLSSSSSSSSSARDVSSDAVALATLATVAANSPPSRVAAGPRPSEQQGLGIGAGQSRHSNKAKKDNATTLAQPSTEIRSQRQPTSTSGSSSSKKKKSGGGASMLAAHDTTSSAVPSDKKTGGSRIGRNNNSSSNPGTDMRSGSTAAAAGLFAAVTAGTGTSIAKK